MKICPKCKQPTLDFDEYFGRFRCYNGICSWMPSTPGERRLRLLQAHKSPTPMDTLHVPDLSLSINVAYDDVNDVLMFAFSDDEDAFEFPDVDPRIMWSIGRQSGAVLGIIVLGATEFAVSEIKLDIVASLEKIAESVKNNCSGLPHIRPTKLAIENVAVTLRTRNSKDKAYTPLADTLKEAVRHFSSQYMSA